MAASACAESMSDFMSILYFDNTGSGDAWKSKMLVFGFEATGVAGVWSLLPCLARAALLAARRTDRSSIELSESSSSSSEF